jgi:hypothetical protein
MQTGKLYFENKEHEWEELPGEYFYNKSLQKGLNSLLHLSEFNNNISSDCASYFNKENKKEFIKKLILKNLIPFKDKSTCEDLIFGRILKSFPNATVDIVTEYQLNIFAKTYIKDKIYEDLNELYSQISNYSEYIFKKYLEE